MRGERHHVARDTNHENHYCGLVSIVALERFIPDPDTVLFPQVLPGPATLTCGPSIHF